MEKFRVKCIVAFLAMWIPCTLGAWADIVAEGTVTDS